MANKKPTQQTMTTEEFVARAKELRDAARAAEEQFLDFLVLGESMTHIWQGTGLTYLQFLKQTNLCEPARYSGWKAIKSNPIVTPAQIKKAGVESAVAAGKLRDPQAQANVIERGAKSAEVNGVQPSGQTARTHAKEEHAKTVGAASVTAGGGAKSYSTLSDENDRLRAENETLRQQNTALRAEIKSLKAQAKASAAAASTAVKPANANGKKVAA